ncbi:MAG: LacI family transcriptional regulator [Clostridiales bacterium]|jgi:LacI family transcriptional regulator|nr:LacI family transcriptional regulator [Clostridiales bacterium]
MSTVRDIRNLTGLSLATISKYLNGGNVLPENREAIDKAVKELNYEVNEIARILKTKKTKIIGVLIHDLNNVFAGKIISTIQGLLRQQGYGVFICDCMGSNEIEKEEIIFLLSKQVDGIITFPTSEDPTYLEPAKRKGIPVVLIDRVFQNQEYNSVTIDNELGAKAAIQKLIEYGHKKIGIICGDDNFYTAKGRLKGYNNALAESGLDTVPGYVLRGKLTVAHGYESMCKIISMGNAPTAVFLSNYEITLGAIIAINELGVNIPKNISVIGFDNLILSNIVKPKLWMVSQPMEDIAIRAAKIMLNNLNSETNNHIEILQTQLIEGESIAHLNK